MTDSIKRFGQAVRTARIKRAYTQMALAEKLNTTNRTVSKIETGRTDPRFDTVALFARELNISLDAFLLAPSEDHTPICVREFFSGMSEDRAAQFIALCKVAALLLND